MRMVIKELTTLELGKPNYTRHVTYENKTARTKDAFRSQKDKFKPK